MFESYVHICMYINLIHHIAFVPRTVKKVLSAYLIFEDTYRIRGTFDGDFNLVTVWRR